ncbi:Na+/H+ antiporter NhaC family protein [bacterium]|nr:Na+/H+ antiporter NhaC family protein [bacterium]
MEATLWALVPPIIAIILALITKQVYISLFAGIFVGGMFFSKGNPIGALETIFEVLASKIGDGWNASILIFLVVLGILVILISKAGGSKAYGDWADKKIKTRNGALLSTMLLGSLIFVDDYFNCLTVGNVMRPVTDKKKISRAKLAYFIDATAAPICIIAPISSWAAAVGSSLEGVDGFSVFLKSIPFNLYAWLTIGMMIFLAVSKLDFGAMRKFEKNALEKGDLFSNDDKAEGDIGQVTPNPRGKVVDLILPIALLIVICVTAMLYTGGLFDGGVNVIDAFANCDAALSLAMGSIATLFITVIYYILRRVVTFKEFAGSIVDGFKAMVPSILILIFAWTLSGICNGDSYLNLAGAPQFESLASLGWAIPAIFFVVSLFIGFSTGTSWGTFALLLPIATAFLAVDSTLFIVSVSSVLAGAVCGDHISPISDTTIMASAGAQCNHVDHVNTQLPYALTVAAVCFIGYLIGGATSSLPYWVSWAITFVISAGLLVALLIGIKVLDKKGKLENLSASFAAIFKKKK